MRVFERERKKREGETDKRKRGERREYDDAKERSKIDWTVVENGRRVRVLVHRGQPLRHRHD